MGCGASAAARPEAESKTTSVVPATSSSKVVAVELRRKAESSLVWGKHAAPSDAECIRNYPELATDMEFFESLRREEFGRLDEHRQIYLDYTGAALYPASLVEAHCKRLLGGVFGNPHSSNPTSKASTNLVEEARANVLKFFNADPAEYDCVFTPNASGALRIIGESYPFTANSMFLLLSDNHNSVNGIREFAKTKGAAIEYIHTHDGSLRADQDTIISYFQRAPQSFSNKLFAFPAQSNFSGVQHPLALVSQAQSFGFDVLLDAAAFVPSNRLDLHSIKPEFVDVSFYKIFGFPTGVGALLVRRKALCKLRKPWFAGGTVEVVFVPTGFFLHLDHEVFEDGTCNFLSLMAVTDGIHFMQRIGMDRLHNRISSLTGFLIAELLQLKHDVKSAGNFVKIYGPQHRFDRGGTVTFNLFDKNLVPIPSTTVERLTTKANLSLREGCFCNPGFADDAHLFIDDANKDELKDELIKREHLLKSDLQNTLVRGAVRASLGMATNLADVKFFIMFLVNTFLSNANEDLECTEA